MKMRRCKICNKYKPNHEYHKCSQTKDGLNIYCKPCKKIKDRRDFINNIEKRKSQHKARYERTYYSQGGYIDFLYAGMIARTKRNPYYKNIKVTITKEEFIRFVANSNFFKLWDTWVTSAYKKSKSPSVDRIDSKGDYSLSNIQIISFSDNARKAHLGIKKKHIDATLSRWLGGKV